MTDALTLNIAPRLTFSSLARYLVATSPTQRRSLIRQQKYPSKGMKLSYIKAEHVVRRHLVSQTQIVGSGDLRSHEADAIDALAATWQPGPSLEFFHPPTTLPKLHISGVLVSCFPTLLTTDGRSRKAGALKIFFNKTPNLSQQKLGGTMANLLHHALGVAGLAAEPRLVQIIEARTGGVYAATGNSKRLIQQVEYACEEVQDLWRRL